MGETRAERNGAKVAAVFGALDIIVRMARPGPTPAQRAIRAHGAYMAGMMRAMMPLPEPPAVGSIEWVRAVEHELMIGGHELDCPECQRAPKYVDARGTVWDEGSAMDQIYPRYAAMIREGRDRAER